MCTMAYVLTDASGGGARTLPGQARGRAGRAQSLLLSQISGFLPCGSAAKADIARLSGGKSNSRPRPVQISLTPHSFTITMRVEAYLHAPGHVKIFDKPRWQHLIDDSCNVASVAIPDPVEAGPSHDLRCKATWPVWREQHLPRERLCADHIS